MLDVLEDWAKIQPNEKCLLQDDKIITYQGLVDGAADNLEAIYDVREDILKAGKRILVDDPDCQLPNEHFERFTDLVNNHNTDPLDRSLGRDKIQANDPFCLIFTSGTTGLPKAAPYTHQAALKSCTMKMMVGMKPGEVGYSALPLYHTFASQVGVTGAIIAGAAVAFAPK